jgi:hypothetical protein
MDLLPRKGQLMRYRRYYSDFLPTLTGGASRWLLTAHAATSTSG